MNGFMAIGPYHLVSDSSSPETYINTYKNALILRNIVTNGQVCKYGVRKK